MKIERFEVAGLAQYSYVISASGKAAVIDAIRDIDRYLEYVTPEGLMLTHVLETHIHADFAAGSTALAKATGAKLALSAFTQGEHYIFSMPHGPRVDGDTIDIGTARPRQAHRAGQ